MTNVITDVDVDHRSNAIENSFESAEVAQSYQDHPKWGTLIEVHSDDISNDLLNYMDAKNYYVSDIDEASRNMTAVTFKPRE